MIPDLIDWTAIKLAKASLHYEDAGNGISERKDFIFSPQKTDTQVWKIEQKNQSLDQITYQVVYYTTDNAQKVVEATVTADPTLILEVPA